MSPEEYGAYKEDIRKNGLRDKVIVLNGDILDKRHGYQACIETGRSFETEEFLESNPKFAPFFKNGQPDIYAFIISTNIRRNLTIDQRACCGADYYFTIKMSPKDQGKLHKGVKAGEGKEKDLKNTTLYKVADIFNVGTTTLGRANFVRTHDRELFERVKLGHKSLIRAYMDTREMLSAKDPGKENDKRGTGGASLENIKGSTSLKIPSCFDNIEIIEIFVNSMCDLGWIFDHKIKDKKHYGHFYGNGFPSRIDKMAEGIGELGYRSCVVVAGRERLESINYPVTADAKV